MAAKPLFSVGGKPFFALGGQPGTNNTYFREDLEGFWRAAKLMRMNTAEMQVFWELLEPEEGVFDFTQVDMLIDECRKHGVKMILVWFATWKNGAMKYAPQWVKNDRKRFVRVTNNNGVEQHVLSSHCRETKKADEKAFCKLVEHLKEVDSEEQTVIGIQVQNEVGIFGTCVRDHGEEANADYAAPVPAGLIDYIEQLPECDAYYAWDMNGRKRGCNWAETFGRDGEEFLTAYSISSYIGDEAAAAKKIYDIPMFVNCWVQGRDFENPGADYPSGGPQHKVFEIWKYAAPALDALCPDNYELDYNGFTYYCNKYGRENNPLYIPESSSSTFCSWQPYAAAGEHDLSGYSIMGRMFNIVAADGTVDESRLGMVQSFRQISDISPLLAKYYGTGKIHAIIQTPGASFKLLHMDGWKALATFTPNPSTTKAMTQVESRHKPEGSMAACLIIQTGENEFYMVGNELAVHFREIQPVTEIWPEHATVRTSQSISYLVCEEGYFDENGEFVVFNKRNGDSNDYGIVFSPKTRVMHIVMDRCQY